MRRGRIEKEGRRFWGREEKRRIWISFSRNRREGLGYFLLEKIRKIKGGISKRMSL